jgi:N-carbamoyl-L-amino-acid hydrolase
MLPDGELDTAVHRQSGLTLREHLRRGGFPWPARAAEPRLRRETIHGFIELHIEQGPILEAKNIPVGVVTAIRGSLRVRDGKVTGEYAHSGAVPHYLRKDAVFAAAEFARACEALAQDIRASGEDIDITLGEFSTNAAAHGLTKVAGELCFTVDVRSASGRILAQSRTALLHLAERVSQERGVRITLGEFATSEPASMDPDLISLLDRNTGVFSIPTMHLPSGAGHDAAEVARCGIPTAMIFVRNANGSHNPNEKMEIEDFMDGVWVLAATLAS